MSDMINVPNAHLTDRQYVTRMNIINIVQGKQKKLMPFKISSEYTWFIKFGSI